MCSWTRTSVRRAKAQKDGKPFFVWLNPTRMHIVTTHLSPKYEAPEAMELRASDDVIAGAVAHAALHQMCVSKVTDRGLERGHLTQCDAGHTQYLSSASRCRCHGAEQARAGRRGSAMQYSQAISGSTAARYGSARNRKETSDEVLVGLVAKGDKGAMQVLYARHKIRVFRFLMRFVGREVAAEDLVSEVFIEAWRHADRFEARSQVLTWLLAIARHKALSALRRRSVHEVDDDGLEFVQDPCEDAEATMQKTERSALIADCLKQLSSAHREIIDLVYYHERTIHDVAEIIGVPQNTVKTRMFYARKHMAELLAVHGLDRA
jgi:RNA polymerase sigma-70 factor, ECF subfamily